jgi:hypothetical protein
MASSHPSVTRTWATFRIWGKYLDPADVTSRLKITPSRSFKAGDPHGEQGVYQWKHGYWGLTSEERMSSTDLGEHLEWLLDQLEPIKHELQTLIQESDNRADLFCFWESESINPRLGLNPSILGRIAALNLRLDLDIYFAF